MKKIIFIAGTAIALFGVLSFVNASTDNHKVPAVADCACRECCCDVCSCTDLEACAEKEPCLHNGCTAL